MQKKHLYPSLIINSLIVLLETYVLTNAYYGYVPGANGKGGQGVMMFRFFTEDSNLVLGFSCLLYVIFSLISLKTKRSYRGIGLFKMIATAAVTTTFLVVLFFLAPATAILYKTSYFMMFSWPNMLFTHFLCPVLAVVSFLFFEEPLESVHNDWQNACFALATVVPYAIIVGTLASLHLISSDETINNVYGFMDATANWWATSLAVVIILTGTYFEGFFLAKLQRKIHSKAVSSAPATPTAQ